MKKSKSTPIRIPIIVPIKTRIYKCTACNREKPIKTNHKTGCIDHCPSCSWNANYAPSFPIGGHKHARLFEYVREE